MIFSPDAELYVDKTITPPVVSVSTAISIVGPGRPGHPIQQLDSRCMSVPLFRSDSGIFDFI